MGPFSDTTFIYTIYNMPFQKRCVNNFVPENLLIINIGGLCIISFIYRKTAKILDWKKSISLFETLTCYTQK